MSKNPFPSIPAALLIELEARFPDRMPDPENSIEDIRVMQGSIKVLRFLRTTFDKQNNTVIAR